MTARNYEGRRFGDDHQVPSLLAWCGGTWHAADRVITPAVLAADSPQRVAAAGAWIIRAADGTCRIERPGSQDGYCTDCGEPVWWQDGQLVIRGGRRWCFGRDDAHPGMSYHHALPGMPQWVARSPDGQVCRCLDRDGPHIHQIIPADPAARPEDAWDAALTDAIEAGRATLAALPYPLEPADRIVYVSALAGMACTLMGLPRNSRWHDRLFGQINGECCAPGAFYAVSDADAAALAAAPGDAETARPGFWRACLTAACPEHAPPGAEPVTRFATQRAWCQHRDADL